MLHPEACSAPGPFWTGLILFVSSPLGRAAGGLVTGEAWSLWRSERQRRDAVSATDDRQHLYKGLRRSTSGRNLWRGQRHAAYRQIAPAAHVAQRHEMRHAFVTSEPAPSFAPDSARLAQTPCTIPSVCGRSRVLGWPNLQDSDLGRVQVAGSPSHLRTCNACVSRTSPTVTPLVILRFTIPQAVAQPGIPSTPGPC